MTTPATTAPDKALDTQLRELKSAFLSDMAEAARNLLPEVVAKVLVDEDLDQQRKFLDLAVTTLGWKQAPPKDAMDNLPVFQFNFTGMGMTGEMTQAAPQPLEMVQEVHSAIVVPTQDPMDDLAELDAALANSGPRGYAARMFNQDVAE